MPVIAQANPDRIIKIITLAIKNYEELRRFDDPYTLIRLFQ